MSSCELRFSQASPTMSPGVLVSMLAVWMEGSEVA